MSSIPIDDGVVVNQLVRGAPDESLRKRILVDNPSRLHAETGELFGPDSDNSPARGLTSRINSNPIASATFICQGPDYSGPCRFWLLRKAYRPTRWMEHCFSERLAFRMVLCPCTSEVTIKAQCSACNWGMGILVSPSPPGSNAYVSVAV